MKLISVVIPCYNEEESLPLYFKAVDKIIPLLNDYQLEFVLVNDGSKDKTLDVMNNLYENRKDVVVCSLSRNYGQNAAFSAGLSIAKGDYVITMDSDLQDPVEMIVEISKKFDEGFDVVNPRRVNRMKDSKFKRDSAGLFYKIINKLEGKNVIPENVNCFRGMSRKVVDHILSLSEKDRLLLAEIPLVGFKTATIDFAREERQAGESKYNLKKMISYALSNMSNITSRPLYFPIFIGGIMTLISSFIFFVLLVLFILSACNVMGGYLILSIFFICSCVFLCSSIIISIIGLVSIYLHNILVNTRNRPTYVIEEIKRRD